MKLIKYLIWILLLMGSLVFLVQLNELNQFDGGVMKYWVDSHDYGVVETAHMVMLHSIIGEDD